MGELGKGLKSECSVIRNRDWERAVQSSEVIG